MLFHLASKSFLGLYVSVHPGVKRGGVGCLGEFSLFIITGEGVMEVGGRGSLALGENGVGEVGRGSLA